MRSLYYLVASSTFIDDYHTTRSIQHGLSGMVETSFWWYSLCMTKTVEAIYDSGVLKPLEALPLSDRQRVRVTVETIEVVPVRQDRSGALQRLIERLKRSSLSYGGALPCREELHERDNSEDLPGQVAPAGIEIINPFAQ